MSKKPDFKLTEGSRYKIASIGGRDHTIDTDGVFKGFANMGIDEVGLLMELSEKHGEMKGKTRIVPLHAILAIDVLDTIKREKKEDGKDLNHYYG